MPSKNKQVKINFPEDQYEDLKQFADSKGITMAKMIRDYIGARLENEPAPKAKKVYKKIPPQMHYEIKMASNNLNQIAKRCNINKSVDMLVYEEVNEVKHRLDRILDDS